MELRQSDGWGKYLEYLGWKTENLEGCAIRIRRLGLLGSIVKIQKPENLPLQEIENLVKKHRALFVRVEPSNESQAEDLTKSGYKTDSWPLNPTRTIFIDLKKSNNELLESFSKDTKQSIKKATQLNLSPIVYNSTSKDFEHALGIFYDLFKQTGHEKKFWIPPLRELKVKTNSFKNNCYLILTFRIDERLQPQTNLLPLSGAFILLHDGVGYYHHAASLHLGQLVKAPYLTLWESLKTANAQGCTRMDLEGIFDSRFPSMFKKWIGFSTFKLKWGGEVFESPPPFTKIYNPIVKLLFKFGS